VDRRTLRVGGRSRALLGRHRMSPRTRLRRRLGRRGREALLRPNWGRRRTDESNG
jgi:hypothetical protein